MHEVNPTGMRAAADAVQYLLEPRVERAHPGLATWRKEARFGKIIGGKHKIN